MAQRFRDRWSGLAPVAAVVACLLLQGCLNNQPLESESPRPSVQEDPAPPSLPPEAVERFRVLRDTYAREGRAGLAPFVQTAIQRFRRGDFIRDTDAFLRPVGADERIDPHAGLSYRARADLASVRQELARDQLDTESGVIAWARDARELVPASVRRLTQPGQDLEALAFAEARSYGGPSPIRGGLLFFNPNFGTNGRSCGTCHAALNRLSIGPNLVQARFALFGAADPLFRSVDADTIGGSTYNRLRQTATFNVNFRLQPNWSVDGCGSAPNKVMGPDGRCTVWVPRGTPSVFNAKLTEPLLMVDGREPTLEGQAPNAVLAHNQSNATSRQFTASEAADVAAFQRELFSSDALRDFADGGPAPTLPPGDNAAEERGRVFFDSANFGPRALCAQCHDGPNLNMTNQFNFAPSINAITGQVNPRLSNNESDLFNPNNLPEFLFRWQEPLDGPGAPLRSAQRVDMGRAMTTGSACLESVLICLFNPGSGIGIFKTPSLWNVGQNPRFFHNNNATTVSQVFAHYLGFFHRTRDRLAVSGPPFSDLAPLFDVTPSDMADAQLYFERHIANVPPPH